MWQTSIHIQIITLLLWPSFASPRMSWKNVTAPIRLCWWQNIDITVCWLDLQSTLKHGLLQAVACSVPLFFVSMGVKIPMKQRIMFLLIWPIMFCAICNSQKQWWALLESTAVMVCSNVCPIMWLLNRWYRNQRLVEAEYKNGWYVYEPMHPSHRCQSSMTAVFCHGQPCK